MSRRKADRIYYCIDPTCKAKFSGTGCIHRVRDHERFTGHVVLKPEQVAA